MFAPAPAYPPPSISAPIPMYPSFDSFVGPSASASISVNSAPAPYILNRPQPPSMQRTIQNDKASLSAAYINGDLSSRHNVATTKWELQCPDCHSWISTAVPSDLALGDIDGHFASLVAHRKGKACAMKWKSLIAQLGQGEQQPPDRTSSAPPDSNSPVKRNDTVWASQNAHEFDDAYMG